MTTKRRVVYLIIIVAVIAVIWWLNRPQPLQVTLHTVERGNVESTVANTRTGTVKACRRSHIVPITSGRVDEIRVREGDRVSNGQLLISLWNDDLAAQVGLARSEANSAKARAEEVCVMAELAEREAKRTKQLVDRGLTSIESYDQSQNNAVARRASCRASQSSVDVANAQLKVAQAALERTLLKAPFGGVVAEVNAELGEVLAPLTAGGEMAAAVDIIEQNCLYISAPIDEIDAPAVQPGMSVYITLDAFPKQRFPGTVRRVAPYVLDLEKQARTVEVEVTFDDAKTAALMLPGYSVDVEVVLDRRENVLWIPTSALLQGNQAWVYHPVDGTVSKQQLEIGMSNWQTSEVTQGLSQGDQIVLPVDSGELTEGSTVVADQADSD